MLNMPLRIALMGNTAAYAASVVTGSTWDTTFNSAVYTFSGGNMIATRAAGVGTGDQTVKGTLSNTSGYFEVVVNAMSANGNVGIVTSAATAADFVGDQGIGIYSGTGEVDHLGVSQGTYSTFTVGDVIGVCIKANKFYVSKNGTWMGTMNPSAGTGGVDISGWFTSGYPAASSNNNTTQNQFTLRTASGFTGTIPTGVSAWG